jgi:hypothetical protein
MSNFFKQPKYILLFACLAILAAILGSAFAASFLIRTVKSDPHIETQFNFPRYLSDTEIAAPPENEGKGRYFFVQTDPKNEGREINWTRVLDNGPYDVVVISDSFLGLPSGKNLCREISVKNNVSVLHIYAIFFENSGGSPFRMLALLTGNGFLKKTGARVVILEDAERTLPGYILQAPDLTRSVPLPSPARIKKNTIAVPKSNSTRPLALSLLIRINSSVTKIDRFFEGNSYNLVILKTWTKNEILSLTGSKSDDGTLVFRRINESRFTSAVYSSNLIFHQNDITAFHSLNTSYPEDCIRMNQNLNAVAGSLQDQNMTLIFIPAVSAYNTYYPYIIDPPTVRNPLFEILRELNRSYILIDTKAVAEKMQQEGQKDLSGIGDPAHWTWKMAEVVGDEIDLDAKPDRHTGSSAHDTGGEYSRAVQAFRTVIYERGDTRDPWAFRNDGLIYEQTRDYLNATRCYQQSLELNPRQPDIRLRLRNITGDTIGPGA